MRIAIPVWNDRVSPVFDVARSIRVVDIADGKITRETNHTFENESRASTLVKLGVDLLICSAISTPLEATLWVSGVEVVSDTCGTVEKIVAAFLSGDEKLKTFRSPGYTHSERSPLGTLPHHRTTPRGSR
jgi:predicted Fe-Mo cluster-binding NifX family protein